MTLCRGASVPLQVGVMVAVTANFAEDSTFDELSAT